MFPVLDFPPVQCSVFVGTQVAKKPGSGIHLDLAEEIHRVAETAVNASKSQITKLTTPVGVNALLIDQSPGRRAATERVLGRLGYCVVGSTTGLGDADLTELQAGPGVVVIGAGDADDDLITQVNALRERVDVPILVLSEDADSARINDAINAGVNAYLVIGVNGNRIKAGIDLALANHRATTELKQALDAAREALADRKIIEKAKGIIMKKKMIDEASAFTMMRQLAMTRGTRLVDVARTLVDAEELLA